jgi:2-polyprenyl-3-methyl-5-hydroxy-6-metoxy-1,4-benzoquinol methylase
MTRTPSNMNEQIFDLRFREQPQIDYSAVTGKPGRRDAKVMQALVGYGITGKRCLDVGPGTGRWLQFLHDHGAAALAAVDVSEEALQRASRMGADCHKADLEHEQLPFESDSFDITLSFMVLEHVKNAHNFVAEIIRVTKPGGLILMSIPNIASLQSRIRLLLGYLPLAVSSDPTHVKFYTPRELRMLCRKHGGEVEVIPTSIALNPFKSKSMRVPSNRMLSGLDDHRLFRIRI